MSTNGKVGEGDAGPFYTLDAGKIEFVLPYFFTIPKTLVAPFFTLRGRVGREGPATRSPKCQPKNQRESECVDQDLVLRHQTAKKETLTNNIPTIPHCHHRSLTSTFFHAEGIPPKMTDKHAWTPGTTPRARYGKRKMPTASSPLPMLPPSPLAAAHEDPFVTPPVVMATTAAATTKMISIVEAPLHPMVDQPIGLDNRATKSSNDSLNGPMGAGAFDFPVEVKRALPVPARLAPQMIPRSVLPARLKRPVPPPPVAVAPVLPPLVAVIGPLTVVSETFINEDVLSPPPPLSAPPPPLVSPRPLPALISAPRAKVVVADPVLALARSETEVLGYFFDSDDDEDDDNSFGINDGKEDADAALQRDHPLGSPTLQDPVMSLVSRAQSTSRKRSRQATAADTDGNGGAKRLRQTSQDPVQIGEDDLFAPPAQNEIRTFQEMREAGTARRLGEEFSYELGGLAPNHPMALRRLSAVEIVRQITKRDKRDRLAASGALGTVLGLLAADDSHDDLLTLAFLAAVLILGGSHGTAHDVLVHDMPVATWLFTPRILDRVAAGDTACLEQPWRSEKRNASLLSDLAKLIAPRSDSANQLTIHSLWIKCAYVLSTAMPSALAAALPDAIPVFLQHAHRWSVTTWNPAYTVILHLVEMASFGSAAVGAAVMATTGAVEMLTRLLIDMQRIISVLCHDADSDDDDAFLSDIMQAKWTAADAAAVFLSAGRLAINLTHISPDTVAVALAQNSTLVTVLVSVLVEGPETNLAAWEGARDAGPLGPTASALVQTTAGGGGTALRDGGAGSQHYSQSQPEVTGGMADLADPPAVPGDMERCDPKLVTVGLLVNLIEADAVAVGKVLATAMVPKSPVVDAVPAVVALAQLLGPLPSSLSSEPVPPPSPPHQKQHQQNLSVVPTFVAVALAAALPYLDSGVVTRVQPDAIRHGLQQFCAYQEVAADDQPPAWISALFTQVDQVASKK
ncbi:hypothetical protein BC828DRAFT_290650 [Blastocladiella britannica]|nr:hypothetical protein BC828DRAFT_290650 [Blastocladiella britannica]